jgi:hypothetical protein
MTRDEISVEMGLKDVGDTHPKGSSFINIGFHITLRVNHSAGFIPNEHIRTVGYFIDEKMFNTHVSTSEIIFDGTAQRCFCELPFLRKNNLLVMFRRPPWGKNCLSE